MNEKEAYLKVASRAVEASEKLVNENHQESSAFYSYHAYESLGGATCSSVGVNYSFSHRRKINQFMVAARQIGIAHGVGRVGIIMASIDRNLCLYPKKETDGNYSLPETKLTKSDAKDLLRRVKGLEKVINKKLAT